MPNSFVAYAADSNGDGKKDIWGTEEDVFCFGGLGIISANQVGMTNIHGAVGTVPANVYRDAKVEVKTKRAHLKDECELGIRLVLTIALPTLGRRC
ncbi:lytic murein transglycosylase [Vibrio lentus]|nr:lytic murein transglycosylase [Vibrio lentus]